ncbi:MAG: carboxypeptidase regulatory-like domain-containing protein [Candidatus Aminicenantes bacterium]|nr:MAG: carboxypeptidase regulatory-like domain-containing protein [Candidatus Aminicenantes bacterium]
MTAEDYGNLRGLIVDKDRNPLQDVKVFIIEKERNLEKILTSDSSGSFLLCGLPLGHYTIHFELEGYQTFTQENISFEPSQTLNLRVVLTVKEDKEMPRSEQLLLDYTNCFSQTILDESQIHESPSAHNVWSLVENQDLSATTNRIDVGGLWGSIPALFSSRGGCSWTQNIYLLNALDVTDPYWTGMPLFYPDFYSLRFTQLINAGLPPQSLSPGSYFNLLTREGGAQQHGGDSFFFTHKNFQSSNVSPSLEKEGIFESHSFNHLAEGNFHLSGPIIPKKLFYFSSLSTSHISRNLADYEKDDKSSIYSGFLSLKYHYAESIFRFIWTGQIITHSSFGAGRHVPFSSTSDRKDTYNVFQAIWDSRIQENHSLKIGLCFAQGDLRSDFQDGFNEQHGSEILQNIPSGAAPLAYRDKRNSLTLLIRGDSLARSFFKAWHRFQYGLKIQHCFSSSHKEILDNLHLRYFESNPLEIIKYNTPVDHGERALHVNLFAQDSLTFSNFISFYLGFNLAASLGWTPQKPSSSFKEEDFGFSREKGKINWLNISPRIGFVLPLTRSKSLALKVSAARYYFTLPLVYLTYGNPNALGGLAYSWNDENEDGQYQEGEAGRLLRREGPFFSTIDADLKRPYSDEYTISLVHYFGSNWYLSVGGFYREYRNLVETFNTGVPLSAYNPLEIFDIGDDRVANTNDDLSFIAYNQKEETLGQDFFILTNHEPGKRRSRYHGFDITVIKKYSSGFSFFFSFTATSAVGKTSPGNTEWENDDGVIGSLYDNPNTLINAKGRTRFDRAYTGRAGFNYLAPFNIRVGCVIKYYDGQPFSRKIIVRGMNQGPFFIQAHARGVSRYEYNRTVDIRLERSVDLGKAKLRIILDGFNILNRGLATEENEWTGPEYPLRFATEIQSPRVFRLGLSYEF